MRPGKFSRVGARLCALAAVLIQGQLAAAAGLTFNTILGPGMIELANTNPGRAAAIQAGFQQAQAIWSSLLRDPIQINLVLDYTSLEAGTLASASGTNFLAPYGNVKTALTNDRTSPDDFTAVANLPGGTYFTGITNDRDGSRYFNGNSTLAGSLMVLNRANAKALGLVSGDSPAIDATIRFNSLYGASWDYTHTPTPGRNDFIGVALHEIGHALGFTSGVTGVDMYTGNGPNANDDVNGDLPGIGDGSNVPVFSVLDLFRHSDESNALGAHVLDLAAGGAPFFQIDGSTPLGYFSTGEYNGDGRQASHWKANVLSIMKPAFNTNTIQDITELDLRAFDVIGYDLWLVPEPGSLALATVALAGILFVVRHRRQDR